MTSILQDEDLINDINDNVTLHCDMQAPAVLLLGKVHWQALLYATFCSDGIGLSCHFWCRLHGDSSVNVVSTTYLSSGLHLVTMAMTLPATESGI